jgi:hypothetical protein
MNQKFTMALEGNYLTVRINLPAYRFADVESVQIGPDPCLSESGPPDLRLIIEICGTTMRPETRETAQPEETTSA